MNILTKEVFFKLGLDSREINKTVIELEKAGWILKERYNPVENGKLKLVFEKKPKDEDTTH